MIFKHNIIKNSSDLFIEFISLYFTFLWTKSPYIRDEVLGQGIVYFCLLPWQSWTSCSPTCWEAHPPPRPGARSHLGKEKCEIFFLSAFSIRLTWVIYLWVELTTGGNIIVVSLPVFKESKDGVEEEEEDHAQDDDLLEADGELWGGHLEGGEQGGGGVVVITIVTTAGAVALWTLTGHFSSSKFEFLIF